MRFLSYFILTIAVFLFLFSCGGGSSTGGNTPPVANAGPDQNISTGSLATLDGSGSSDADGNALTFSWSITSRPDGSSAVLSSANIVNPTFTADVDGTYTVHLIVNDGTMDSALDSVVITATTGNSAPFAYAGPDRNVATGSLVTLDASGSSDADGDPLTYTWELVSTPAGSAASLLSSNTPDTSFTADVEGSYVINLVVNDGTVDSSPDTITITAITGNAAPVADAGPDQIVSTGSYVTLDGSGSADPDGDAIAYYWSFDSAPAGSIVLISGRYTESAAFAPDVDGTYVISLVVNDGTAYSEADTVTITASTSITEGMATIPTGCFDMGDTFNEGVADELPVHNVCITRFSMDVHEVTNAEYKACADAAVCTAPTDRSSQTRISYYGNPLYDNYPVIYVEWAQAVTYCTWAGKRLPTEAEWEYAARGGLAHNRYPWGDTLSCSDANYASPSFCVADSNVVTSLTVNGYGLYDMAGNVWEWVNDRYSATYYSTSPANDPQGPATGNQRVLRGGAWVSPDYNVRVSNRTGYYDWLSNDNLGFRCAKN